MDSKIFLTELLKQPQQLHDYIAQSRIVIVTEAIIKQHYLCYFSEFLRKYDHSILELPGGESNKNWALIEQITLHLLQHGHDRNSKLISMGGGVIGDLCGFAASIYMRGIDWIQIPTTLLAQVDAAIGGKTGFNFAGNKNLLGTFHQPLAIFIDPNFVQTLPAREYAAGLAEVVKYGMCCDADFFLWLEANVLAIKAREPAVVQMLIERCCALKQNIVAQDVEDRGLRKILNFGHTFAHALEAATNFKQYLHGEAVAIGMLLATHLAVKLELVESGLLVRLRDLLTAMGIKTSYDTSASSMKMLFDYMKMDKKRCGLDLCLILPCSLGQVRSLQYTDINYLEGLMDGYTNC